MLQSPEILYWFERIETKEYIWDLTVASTSQGLCWVGLGEPEAEEKELKARFKRWLPQAVLSKEKEPNIQAIEQLEEFFLGRRQEFILPLHQLGTPFQLSVWEELLKIPYGETCSYGEIAHRIGNPKGQRAVGMANHNNPIGVIVPCHRVVGKGGNLTGYAGGIHLKERLITLEKQHAGKLAQSDIGISHQ